MVIIPLIFEFLYRSDLNGSQITGKGMIISGNYIVNILLIQKLKFFYSLKINTSMAGSKNELSCNKRNIPLINWQAIKFQTDAVVIIYS